MRCLLPRQNGYWRSLVCDKPDEEERKGILCWLGLLTLLIPARRILPSSFYLSKWCSAAPDQPGLLCSPGTGHTYSPPIALHGRHSTGSFSICGQCLVLITKCWVLLCATDSTQPISNACKVSTVKSREAEGSQVTAGLLTINYLCWDGDDGSNGHHRLHTR